MKATYDVGCGIVLHRHGDNVIVDDVAQGKVSIPLVLGQDDDLLLIDALRSARKDWEREENERQDRERMAAWNQDVVRSYEPRKVR